MDALQQITTEMGATYWRFNGDLCEVDMVGISPTPPSGSEGYVECNCNFNNHTVCHVTKMYCFILLSFLSFSTIHFHIADAFILIFVDVQLTSSVLIDLIQSNMHLQIVLFSG